VSAGTVTTLTDALRIPQADDAALPGRIGPVQCTRTGGPSPFTVVSDVVLERSSAPGSP